MLNSYDTGLIVIDVQGRLSRTVCDAGIVLANLERLIKGAMLFSMPIVLTEQNPQGLGPTIPELRKLLGDLRAVEKVSFNACLTESFVEKIKETGRKRFIICGIETHVCVYQTAAGLLEMSYDVHAASDAVSSRTAWNRDVGLSRMRDMGAAITTTEMALFELMKEAEGGEFKQFVKIVK